MAEIIVNYQSDRLKSRNNCSIAEILELDYKKSLIMLVWLPKIA